MSYLKFSIIIMRCDFTSESCFSGMLKYPGLIVVGELGSDDAKKPWFLLLMFCSYVCHLITSGVVCSCCFTVACPFWERCVGAPVRPALSGRNFGMRIYGPGSSLGCRQKPKGSFAHVCLGAYVLRVPCESL